MDMDPLQIAPARIKDLPGLLDLYQHLIRNDDRPAPDLSEAILGRFQSYPGSAIFLGWSGEIPVASCTLVVVPNLTHGGRSYGLIENVVTHARFRNRGYARAMLDHACATAWQDGCYKVMLMSGSTNPATLRFYRAAGFTQSKTGFQKRRLPARADQP